MLVTEIFRWHALQRGTGVAAESDDDEDVSSTKLLASVREALGCTQRSLLHEVGAQVDNDIAKTSGGTASREDVWGVLLDLR